MNKKENHAIHCSVHDCEHCNCECDACQLDEIKVCHCDNAKEKEATMCNSYKRRK